MLRNQPLWVYLVHLGFNMWADWEAPALRGQHEIARPYLRFDDSLWNELVRAMREVGISAVLLELGDGVRYESHPELAVEGAWTTARLRSELARLRSAGLEPLPMLNFSTAHDLWLGPYSRAVSTPRYYEVCVDLIDEVFELFDAPRLFHLGMDEEGLEAQKEFEYVVIRQHDLWWRDFLRLAERVRAHGARPWIWSDYAWTHREAFLARMPKWILQSNWYYSREWDAARSEVRTYLDLDTNGFDQMPCGTTWSYRENFADTVNFCLRQVSTDHLYGFVQTSWKPTIESCRAAHLGALEMVREARRIAVALESSPPPATRVGSEEAGTV